MKQIKRIIKIIKEKLKMIDYKDGLGYQNQKLCLMIPYKYDRTSCRILVLNPIRTSFNTLGGCIITTNKLENTMFTKYKLIDSKQIENLTRYTYQIIGLYWN